MAPKLHILIIDGSPVHIKVLRHLLQNSKGPYRVSVSETLVGGYAILAENEVHLVLLDLNLPGIKEYQLLPNFRTRFPNIPVILLVNRDNEVLFQQAVKAGISDYLIKGEVEARQLRRSITLAMQSYETVEALRKNNQDFQKVSHVNQVAEELTGYGIFTLDIVSNQMEWTPGVYHTLGIHKGTVSAPTLSTFLDLVHHLDRAMVADFFLRTAEEVTAQSLKHRILRDGHRIKWVTLVALSTYLPSTNQTAIVGVVSSAPSSKVQSSGNEKNRGYLFNVTVSLKSALRHHSSSLHLYRKISEALTDTVLISQFKQLKVEHEVLIELFYRSMKDNLGAISSSEGTTGTVSTKALSEHLQNYFWMRITNNEQPATIRFDLQHIEQIEADYLFTFLLFACWIDLILFDLKKAEWNAPQFEGEILNPTGDDWILQLKISGLLRPVWNQLPDQLIAKYGPDSPMIPNINVIGYALENELCKIEFRASDSQTFIEVLEIPVIPIKSSKQSRFFSANNPIRLLIAEDHFLNQINYRSLCEEVFEFLHLDIVSNGREAVEKVAQEKQYDLIILDLEMPVLGGIEAARQIIAVVETPILAMSLMASHQKISQAYEVGVKGFIEKPLKKRNLLAAVREHL